MTLRARFIGGIVFVIALLVGAIFSVVSAIAAAVGWLVLVVASVFKEKPEWLRPVWYGGLLVGAGITYFVAPTSVVGGAVATCEEIPAAPLPGTEKAVAHADLPSTPQADFLRNVQRQTVQLLAQASAIRRAHELLPQVRAVARAFAQTNSTAAASLASAADQFQERLVAEQMNSPEAIQTREQQLQQLLTQLRKETESDGAAVDLAARGAQMARIINEHSFDAVFTAMSTLIEEMNQVVRQHGGLTLETDYRVNVAPGYVRYAERVDLHLSQGHFVNLDLSELGLQAGYLGPGTQIVVGGDGLAAETFAPDQLSGPLSLSTRPRSVWVETRMQVPPGPQQACPGASLMPFERVRLSWPQPFDTQIRGLTQLPLSDEPVPFTQRINKKQARLTEVLLPRYSLFVQSPVQLKPSEMTRFDGIVADRFVPATEAVTVADFSTTAELLPDTRVVRNEWVYEKRGLFFPVNWTVALVYLLIASAIGDVFLSKRANSRRA